MTDSEIDGGGGLPTAAIVNIDAESGYPFADITDYGYHLRKGDKLVRRSDVKALIQDKISDLKRHDPTEEMIRHNRFIEKIEEELLEELEQ